MFAVMFEVQPKAERRDEYLEIAKGLRPLLDTIDGFLDVERFASGRTAGRVLSLSTWRDEKSVVRWRTHATHHGAQSQGRYQIFQDYRLRVGEVTADTHPPTGGRVHEQRFDVTEAGAAKVTTVTELTYADESEAAEAPARWGLDTAMGGLVDQEWYTSLYCPGRTLLLAGWLTADAALAVQAPRPALPTAVRQRHVRVVRDYGMHERREAPQYYRPVEV